MVTNLTSIAEDAGLISGLDHWVKGSGVAVSCGVGHRRGLGPTWLWLWCRPAATAPTGPLAWEPPYAKGVAQEMAKKKKKTVHPEISSFNISACFFHLHTYIDYKGLSSGLTCARH